LNSFVVVYLSARAFCPVYITSGLHRLFSFVIKTPHPNRSCIFTDYTISRIIPTTQIFFPLLQINRFCSKNIPAQIKKLTCPKVCFVNNYIRTRLKPTVPFDALCNISIQYSVALWFLCRSNGAFF